MPLLPGLLGLATLVAVSSHAPEETPANREQAYWTIVEQYLHGDRSRAVSAIASWSGKDLGAVEDSIAGMAKTAQKCARCEARTRLEALPLPAAVLLLAERDRADRVIAVSRNGGQPDCSIGSHEALIEHLLRFVRLQSGSAGFAERFLTARSLGNWADLCLEDARRVAADGLDESPRDAMLHFAHGLAHEAMGTLGSAGPSRPKAPDPRPQRGDFSLRPVDYSSAAERKNRLELARRSFEKALSESPNFGEARLRLGRIQWRLGRLAEARASLKRAVDETTAVSLYLAHLFLGQVLEDMDDVDTAISEYRAAVALQPRSQSGAVALSQGLALRGDVESARRLLEGVLVPAGQKRTADPYWSYVIGTPGLAEGLFNDLRNQAAR